LALAHPSARYKHLIVSPILSTARTMRLFWEIVSLSLRRQVTYRAATWAGLATNLFFGVLRAYVMIALYAGRSEIAGLTIQDAITYTALSQAVIAYLSIFGWWDVMESVNSGEVAADMLRPMSYLRFWMAADLGRALVNIVLRGATILLIYRIFVPLTLPTSLWQWLAFFMAVLLGWLVSFGWRFLVNLAAFWTPNARGIGRFAYGVMWILSGFYMPLALFPDWFRTLCEMTPFPAMVSTPIEIFLGQISGLQIAEALLNQAIWSIVLLAVAQLVLHRGVRRLVIQGG
jgi:ABC-2 type transport system permease protein